MHIHRIIFRNLRNFVEIDLTLHNNWTEQPLQSVLITGPNGSGKTTLLRVIAALWENLDNWSRLGHALYVDQMAQRDLLTNAGLAAIEIHGLQPFPVWLFVAESPERWEELRQIANQPDAQFVGEIRGGRGRPQFEPKGEPAWLMSLNTLKEQLMIGLSDAGKLPNLLFLEAETRTILAPQKRQGTEFGALSSYFWHVKYEARERWEGHIETMLRYLKVLDPVAFRTIVDQISTFLGPEKRITDFDNNLRLQVQIGTNRRNTHTIDALSSGEKQCLILLFTVARSLVEGGVVLIDEPDLHLHVSLQRQFIHEVERLVLAKQGQLIVSSHSPTLWEEYSGRQRIELGQREHG